MLAPSASTELTPTTIEHALTTSTEAIVRPLDIAKLARLVGGICDASPVPVSVKLRLSPAGPNDANYLEHVAALRDLGKIVSEMSSMKVTMREAPDLHWARCFGVCGFASSDRMASCGHASCSTTYVMYEVYVFGPPTSPGPSAPSDILVCDHTRGQSGRWFALRLDWLTTGVILTVGA